jgi:CHASE3 domain sensor protein
MGKDMIPKEQRIEQVKNKITESKNELKASNQNGPMVVALVGIVLMLIGVIFIAGFGIGFIMVLLAVVWSYSKSQEATKLKAEIFQYERELYSIEKEP